MIGGALELVTVHALVGDANNEFKAIAVRFNNQSTRRPRKYPLGYSVRLLHFKSIRLQEGMDFLGEHAALRVTHDPHHGAVAELVGNEGGVVSGVINLESSGVEASDWRPRHDEHYHEA
jgi:hypothetical protein